MLRFLLLWLITIPQRDSDTPIPSMSCGSLRESSEDGDRSSSQDQLSPCEPTLESFIKPSNSNLLVVSGLQSIFTIISPVDNLCFVDPGTVKDPDLSFVQETSYSEESNDEDPAFYVISSPSPWKPVIYDSSGCMVREGKPVVSYF